MSERTMQKEVQHKIRSNRLGTNKKVPELWMEYTIRDPTISVESPKNIIS